jgi:hypothetical protein
MKKKWKVIRVWEVEAETMEEALEKAKKIKHKRFLIQSRGEENEN